jgi:hypothetical protein
VFHHNLGLGRLANDVVLLALSPTVGLAVSGCMVNGGGSPRISR